ncbi:S49 family peptidase, partial [Salipiger manganoxidans]|nr:S49 family peptidase [Salipiger manganoxidans]
PEAAGREDLARSFAFDSDMSSAEAIRHLASAAKAGAAAGLSASIDAEATELETPSAGEAGAPDITQRAAKRYG